MDFNSLVNTILSILTEVIEALVSGSAWRKLWRLFRREMKHRVFIRYIKPAIDNVDLSWTDDALAIIYLLRLILATYWSGQGQELRGRAKTELRTDANGYQLLKEMAEEGLKGEAVSR